MSTIVTRTGKGSALTTAELDGNFTALNSDKAELSGATFTGAITANAGVVVDNITIDGTEIDLSSGDLTLDVAGGLIIDNGGNDTTLKAAGTTYAFLSNSSGSLQIYTPQHDKDIIFKGQDGASTITMLTLDSSAAGNATFSNNVTAGGAFLATTGVYTGNGTLFGAATLSLKNSSGTSFVDFASGGAATFSSTVTANAGVVVDNITIDGTEIDLSSGDLTVDVAGVIVLDADNVGAVQLKEDGTHYGTFFRNGNNLTVESNISDADVVIRGSDAGSTITALTLDMSDAGTAIFNHNITLPDAGEVQMGDNGDFRFFHDGSNNYIKGVTLDQDVIIQGNDGDNIINALTLDMSDAGTAIFNHDVKLGDGSAIRLGNGPDLFIEHSGTNASVANYTGHFYIAQNAADQDIILQCDDGSGGITAYVTLDGSADRTVFSRSSRHNDNVVATFGTSEDLQIYHDGSNSYIKDLGTGSLIIQSSDNIKLQAHTGEFYFQGIRDGAAKLYFDNAEKLLTTSTGVSVTGVIANDNRIETTGSGIFINAASGNPDITLKTAGAGNNPLIRIQAATNYWDISGLFSNTNDELSFGYNGTSKLLLTKDGAATFSSSVATDTLQNASGNLNILSTQSILLKFDSDNNQTNRELNIQSNSGDQLVKITEDGTTTFTGAVTANAGVVVDNISIDGSAITAGSANDLTIDAVGNIILDADGGDVVLKDGGTEFSRIKKSGNDLQIQSRISDADIVLKGFDDSSLITALTLDMSAAGAATFNAGATFSGIVTSSNTSQGNFVEGIRLENSGGGSDEGAYIQWEIANTSGYGPRIGGRREGTGGMGLHFYTGEINATPTEKMRLDHDGKLGIGTSSPAKKLNAVDSTALQAEFSGYSHASAANNARAASGSIRLGNGAGTTGLLLDYTDQGQTVGLIKNEYIADATSELRLQSPFLSFYTGTSAAERMRIDSSGTVLVGKTEDGTSNAGHVLFATGAAYHIRSGGFTNFFNRTSSDGEILRFAKDGTTVGNIDARGGDIVIRTGDTGIRFSDAENAIMPHHATDVIDNQIDIGFAGSSNYRFKDLHLSGNVNAGGIVDGTNFKINGAQGSDGQVLTSTGSGVAWEDASGGGGGSNPNGFPYSRVPTTNITNDSTGTPGKYWYPSDLVEHRNSGTRYTQNKIYYVPWLAPMTGTIEFIGANVTSNNAASGENIYYGIYNSTPAGTSSYGAGTPYTRIGFGTFSLHGAGTGHKSVTPTSDGTGSGSAATVTQGELYYLAFGADLANYSNLYVNSYRRNSFMPFTAHQMTGTDYSYFANGLPSTVSTAATTLNLTTNQPATLFALYA